MPRKTKKPNHGFFLFLLPLALYMGYCFGTLEGVSLNLENLQELLYGALLHPFPVKITALTPKAVGLAVLIWGMAYLSHVSGIRNNMPGLEYGSARLASPKEAAKALQDRDPRKNKILSEHLSISMDTRATKLNNNMLVIGGAGSGKSFNVVKPNGYACNSAYVFCDPKGELLRDIGNYLQVMGWEIKVLNLVEMAESDGYNPFVYLRKEQDVIKLITNLIENTTPKNATSSDPFWTKAESMLLQALMLYVWYEYPKVGKEPNFRGLLELLNLAKISEDEREESKLDELFARLPENHPALVTYKKVKSGAADTMRSILISAHARLSYLQNEEILRILDQDEMDIPALGTGKKGDPKHKTALFCIIPDNDKSYNFLVGVLYTQIFQELYYVADHQYGGRLPVPVALWMDEFANTALPDGFLEILATCRSREISCNIIIQNLAQLKTLFKDAWETVTGNCDVLLYLGGNEQSTHKYISEMLGKVTIDKKSTGETLGSHGSSSRNYDVLGRELLTPDEVRKLDNNKCLIFIKGRDPILDEKYKTWEKDAFHLASRLGAYLF